MKNLTLTIVIVFFVLSANAQINLESTYAYSASVNEVKTGEFFYYLMDVPQKQCRLYNTNHELLKSINLTIPEGYYLSDIKFLTKSLFNNDDLIELLYMYEKYITTESGYYFQYGLAVVNENGTKLLTLPNGGWAEIKQVEGESKLLAYSYIYNPEGYYNVSTNVYCLGGSSNTKSIMSENETGLVYPNPASESITIEPGLLPELNKGEFILYNAAGQKLISEPISNEKSINIPVQQLPAGAYFYTIKDGGKLLKSSKIIVR